MFVITFVYQQLSSMTGESKQMGALTLNIGLGCLGAEGAAVAVVAAGAGAGLVTWSAGNDSGTV